MPITAPAIKNGAVVVEEGRILELGKRDELKKRYSRAKEFHYPLLIPALVNAHTHLELSSLSLLGHQNDFVSWLVELIKRKNQLTPEQIKESAEEEIKTSLELGITSLGDIVSEPIMLEVHRSSPLFSIVFWELLGRGKGQVQAKLERAKSLLGSYNYHLNNSRIGFSPHTPYTASLELYQKAKHWAEEKDLPLCTHLAESEEELELVKYGRGRIKQELYSFVGWGDLKVKPLGKSPCELLAEIIDERISLVHCLEVSDSDLEIICRARAVIHCPRSNLYLSGKLARIPEMLDMGIVVGLGTDSPASAGDNNLWKEMQEVLSRAGEYPGREIKPYEILKMATIGSARAIFREKELGSIEKKKLANLVGIDLRVKSENLDSISQDLIEGALEQKKFTWIAGEKIANS